MVFTLVTASVFQGLAVVQVYAVPMFEEAIPSISPNVASTILAIVGIVTGFLAAYMLEIVGRRVRHLDHFILLVFTGYILHDVFYGY